MTIFIGFIAITCFIYFGIRYLSDYTVKKFKFFYRRKAKRVTETRDKHNRNGMIISIVIFIIAMGLTGTGSKTKQQSTQSDTAKTVKVVKKTQYVGKSKYNIAKKENLALIAKEKKLSQQESELASQESEIKSDDEAAQQKQQDEQAAAQKQAEQTQQAQQKQQEQSQQQESSTQTRGDMNTSDSGQVVGNVNSKIYHVPGQAGYSMNSSNAVYFNSEQDAINAGYRRAKR